MVTVLDGLSICRIVYNNKSVVSIILLQFKWDCKLADDPCDFENGENSTLSFPSGLPNLGRYVTNLIQFKYFMYFKQEFTAFLKVLPLRKI